MGNSSLTRTTHEFTDASGKTQTATITSFHYGAPDNTEPTLAEKCQIAAQKLREKFETKQNPQLLTDAAYFEKRAVELKETPASDAEQITQIEAALDKIWGPVQDQPTSADNTSKDLSIILPPNCS